MSSVPHWPVRRKQGSIGTSASRTPPGCVLHTIYPHHICSPRHIHAPTPYMCTHAICVTTWPQDFRPRGIPGYAGYPHHITTSPTPYALSPTLYTHTICMSPTLYVCLPHHIETRTKLATSALVQKCRLVHLSATMLWQNAGKYARRRMNAGDGADEDDDGTSTSTETSTETETTHSEGSAMSFSDFDVHCAVVAGPPPAVPAPDITPPDILSITRRKATYGTPGVPMTPNLPPRRKRGNPRNIFSLQKLWHEHCYRASQLYPKNVWRIIHAVKLESKVTQTNVLRACVPLLAHSALKN